MRKNKYQHKDMDEVWESWEFHFKELLEKLDHKTRRMISDMQTLHVNMTLIRRYVPKKFEELWERVAAEQEEKHGRSGNIRTK
ncbi:MAG: hypothetical protein J7559_00025 [Cohnella sp.]|nr:hypothetical protein [Cohnella sp.]